jgi:transposase
MPKHQVGASIPLFKFRLNPTPEQAQQMVEFAGANRFVWNKALALNLSRLENNQPLLWYFELVYWLGLWKQSEEYGFLKSVHSQPLQQTLKDLARAFSDAFDKTQPLKRIPRFKKKGAGGTSRDSFRYPQGCKLDEKAKSGLNRSILDQGWGMFVRMLEYKQTWLGGEVIKVNPQHTSQTCPCCHHVSKDNRTT